MEPINFNLSIGVIKISMVENASAVNIGKNLLVDWDSHSKTNQGLGNISGDSNTLDKTANNLEDPDGIDFMNSSLAKQIDKDNIRELAANFFGEEN